MKKRLLVFLTALCLVFSAFAVMSACTDKSKNDTNKETDTYTVTFVTNGGTAISPAIVEDGEKIPSVTTTRENHAFDGWHTDTALTQDFDTDTPIHADLTLYAAWVREYYTVTLILPGNNTATKKIAVGGKLDLGALPDYDDSQYECLGWTDENGNEYAADAVIDVESDLVLTGSFERLVLRLSLDEETQTYSIVGLNDRTITEYTIPETHNGLPITRIITMASTTNTTLKTLVVPDTITTIAQEAFGNLAALESLDVPFLGARQINKLPEAVEDLVGVAGIFGYWFNETDNLYYERAGYHTIATGYNTLLVTTNDNGLVYGTYREFPLSLKTVTVRHGVILDYAFSNVVTLEKVILGDDVTAMGGYAFVQPGELDDPYNVFKTVELGANFTTFGIYSFYNNTGLTDITIPAGVTELPHGVFQDTPNLKNVTFAAGSQLKSIADYAFYRYNPASDNRTTSLVSLELPESLEYIGELVFENHTALKSIVIPKNVSYIGGAAFRMNKGLESVTFDADNQMTTLTTNVFNGCSTLSSVTLPATLNIIGNGAFRGCTSLAAFNFDQLLSIGEYAFEGTGFTSITIHDNVTSLGDGAFQNCFYLETVNFEGNFNGSINFAATFDNCELLESITFPSDITTIGAFTFRNCGKLATVTIPASVVTIGDSAFGGQAGALKTLTFETGSKLETIGSMAFWSRETLTSVSLPASLVSIGDSAFRFCYNLTSVTFGEGSKLETIGSYAFHRCYRLASLELPEGLVSIGDAAFMDCVSLTELTVPSSVEKMGGSAFARSNEDTLTTILGLAGLDLDIVKELTIHLNLTFAEAVAKNWPTGSNSWSANCTVEYRDDNLGEDDGKEVDLGDFKGILMGTTVTVIEYTAGNAEVVLPETFVYDGKTYTAVWSSGLFSGNTKITAVTLPSNMTEIPASFFADASKLVTVYAEGFKIKKVGDNAFSGCTALSTFSPDFSELISVGSRAFFNCRVWEYEFTLPSTLTSLGESAFFVNSTALNIEGLRIIIAEHSLDGLTEIAESAFGYARVHGDPNNNNVLTIPGNIKTIGRRAFYMTRLGNIHGVVIESGVETIGEEAFGSASMYNAQSAYNRLAYIVIKGTPKSIGSMFAGSNFTASGTSSNKAIWTPIYFTDMTFTQNADGTVSTPDGWDSKWYFHTWKDDEMEGTYSPVYGKGAWGFVGGEPAVGASINLLNGSYDIISDEER